MTKKEEFLKDINNAIAKKEKCSLTVRIDAPDLVKCEQIINPHENLPIKRDYYERAYNDDLELIGNPVIKIVDWYLNINNPCRKKEAPKGEKQCTSYVDAEQ